MKILFIHHSGLVGGAGVSLINLLKETAISYDVTVSLPNDPQDMINLAIENKINNDFRIDSYGRRIGALTWYSGGDKWWSLRFWYRISLIIFQWQYWNQYIDSINPDLIICNSKILCWMSLLPSIKRRKSICFVRETMNKTYKHILNKIIKFCLDHFTGVAFISEFDRKVESLKKSKTFTIPNYVDINKLNKDISRTEACDQLKISSKNFNVLYVGGVFPLKGFDFALKAILNCSKNVHLIVAGVTFDDVKDLKSSSLKRYSEIWQNFITEKDIGRRIHILGKQLNMSACYASCDVLIFPMREPHQARPIFEAGYFSKPVIVTDFNCVHNDVQNKINGYLVPLGDVEAISEKIMYLYSHPNECLCMGRKNHEFYKLNHSYESSIKLFRNCIEEILKI